MGKAEELLIQDMLEGSSWRVTIIRGEKGFALISPIEKITIIGEANNRDILKTDVDVNSASTLLDEIAEHFNLSGSRYDKERIRVITEVGDKYELADDEKYVEAVYYTVKKK